MSFGKNLARFRKEKGLTQNDLVKKSKIAISQVRRYEANKSSPTLEVIKRLAKTLGISLDELVFNRQTGVASQKIMDKELLEQFEAISTLDADEKQAIKIVLGSVIVKHQVEQAIMPKKDKSWAQRMKEITNRMAQGAEEYSEEDIENIINKAVKEVQAENHVPA